MTHGPDAMVAWPLNKALLEHSHTHMLVYLLCLLSLSSVELLVTHGSQSLVFSGNGPLFLCAMPNGCHCRKELETGMQTEGWFWGHCRGALSQELTILAVGACSRSDPLTSHSASIWKSYAGSFPASNASLLTLTFSWHFYILTLSNIFFETFESKNILIP